VNPIVGRPGGERLVDENVWTCVGSGPRWSPTRQSAAIVQRYHWRSLDQARGCVRRRCFHHWWEFL